jgi:hypothetical protein
LSKILDSSKKPGKTDKDNFRNNFKRKRDRKINLLLVFKALKNKFRDFLNRI